MEYKRVRRRSRSRKHSGVGRWVVLGFAAIALAFLSAVLWQRYASQSNALISINSSASQTLLSLGTFQSGRVRARTNRVVYPYSVVPGGVFSPAELREAAAHDPVVAHHYSGFDYQRARVVEVKEPRLVYLSYRKGDHVYWSRKQGHLHKGEKLITDGHITARERCGNQVSVLPQANTSPNEPTMAELDRPDAIASGMQQNFPSTFDSRLLDADPGLPFSPSGVAPNGPLAGGPFPGGFMPMPIGGGVSVNPNCTGSNCNPPPPPCTGPGCNPPPPCTGEGCNPPPPPPTVPEPTTILLVGSGAAIVISRMRHKKN